MKLTLLHSQNQEISETSADQPDEDLIRDLDLGIILDRMSSGDNFIREVCKNLMLHSLTSPDEILRRQESLRDALANRECIEKIYTEASKGLYEARRKFFWIERASPEFILGESLSIIDILVKTILNIREIIRPQEKNFRSDGFIEFLNEIGDRFDEQHALEIQAHLRNLRFTHGITVTGVIGRGSSLSGLTVIKDMENGSAVSSFARRITGREYTYVLPERDENGGRILSDLRVRSLGSIIGVTKRTAENFMNFMKSLKEATGFFKGCINLMAAMEEIGMPIAFPIIENGWSGNLKYKDIYDISLAVRINGKAIGNSLETDHGNIIFITGPNSGGKSTLLRSLGQSQVMMQCGMFIPGNYFSAPLFNGIFTHFSRDEDVQITAGKMENELIRMSNIVEKMSRHSLILMNESFSSTDSREGSQISWEIIEAFSRSEIRVACVTHFYELVSRFLDHTPPAEFLRAERLGDGTRTFAVKRAEPLKTSYGYDLYTKVMMGHHTNQ